MKIEISDVEIDFFTEEDVEAFAKYWYESTPEFWRARGVAINRMIPRDEFMDRHLELVEVGIPRICTVVYKGKRIGAHPLTHIEDHHRAMMHAHYWDKSARGKGIGPISYVKAMDWHMKENEFSSIYFYTPKNNTIPVRVKEKLKIPVIDEVIFDLPLFTEPQPAWYSEVKKSDLPALYKCLEELYK